MSATIGLAVAMYFAASGFGKFAAPQAVANLLTDVGMTRPSPSVVARVVASTELGIAAALITGSTLGSAIGLVALATFTAVLVIAVRRGSQAPCGCLGDVGSGRVGRVPIVRNLLLASGILVAWGQAAALEPAVLAAAAGTAVLLIVVPEALQTVGGLREARRRALLEN